MFEECSIDRLTGRDRCSTWTVSQWACVAQRDTTTRIRVATGDEPSASPRCRPRASPGVRTSSRGPPSRQCPVGSPFTPLPPLRVEGEAPPRSQRRDSMRSQLRIQQKCPAEYRLTAYRALTILVKQRLPRNQCSSIVIAEPVIYGRRPMNEARRNVQLERARAKRESLLGRMPTTAKAMANTKRAELPTRVSASGKQRSRPSSKERA